MTTAQKVYTHVDDNRLPFGHPKRALGLYATGTAVWRDGAWYVDDMELISSHEDGGPPREEDTYYALSELERIAAENCPMADAE